MWKNKIIYLVLLALLWLTRILYSFRITAVMFYVFLLLPAVLFVLLLIQAARIKPELTAENGIVEKKVPFSIGIRLENKNILPVGKVGIRIKYRNVLSGRWMRKKLFLSVGRGTESYHFVMCCDYSAKLEVRLVGAKLYDVLNLFSLQLLSRRKRAQNAVSIIVLPKIDELGESPACANPHVMVDSDLYSDVKSGDDSTEIFQIREYMQGDRMNRIHWKLSVKEGELMVKEFGLPIDCSVLILMDFGWCADWEEQLLYRDAVLEAALSLSYRMVLDGQVHSLAWYDGKEKRNERARILGIEDFYDAEGRILEHGGMLKDGNVPLLYFAEFFREQYSNLFYIAADPAGSGRAQDAAKVLLEHRKSAWLSMLFVRKAGAGEEDLFQEDGVQAEVVPPGAIEEGLNRMLCRKGGALWEED